MKNKNIIILFASLILLGVAYYFIQKIVPPSKEKAPNQITIFSTDSNNILEYEVKNEKNSFIIYKKDEKEYAIKGMESLKFNQSAISSLAYGFSNIVAESVVEENAADLSKYGLTNETEVLKIKLKDQSVKTFILGNKTPANENYYFTEKGTAKVFAISSFVAKNIKTVLTDLRERQIISINAENVQKIEMTRKQLGDIEISQRTENDKGGFSAFVMRKPYNMDANDDTVKSEILDKLSLLKVDEFVDDNPKNLEKYGLLTPNQKLVITEKENKKTEILFGNKSGDITYFMQVGDNSVYGIDSENVSYLTINPIILISKLGMLINISEVKNMNIKAGDVTYNLSYEKQGEKEIYKINGKVADEERFKNTYQKVIGTTIIDVAPKNVKGEPEIVVTVDYNNGKNQSKTEFIPIDERKFAVRENGKTEFSVLKKQVFEALEALEELNALTK